MRMSSSAARPAVDEAPYGRGIALLRSLCDALEYHGSGNEVEAHVTL